jgi:Protein of unknown function (DUF3574)
LRHNSNLKQVLAALVLAWILAPSLQAQNPDPTVNGEASISGQSLRETFVRTELYFGTARLDYASVSEAEWRGFLDSVITKRFPEGLTVIRADGQVQDDSGNVNKEKAFLLILLYPLRDWKEANESIEFIRNAYKKKFKQQSVLRVDFGPPVKVSF